jgi:hypothetical protein
VYFTKLDDGRELRWPDVLTVTDTGRRVPASRLLHIRFGTERCMGGQSKDPGALDASWLVEANGFR